MGALYFAEFRSALATRRRAILNGAVKALALTAPLFLFDIQTAYSVEETAAIPRASELRLDLTVDARLPKVLSEQDKALYPVLFELHRDGDWRKADKLMKKLDDKSLVGTLMAMRYLHPTKYRSKYQELKTWMGKYADHPDATRIYRLAMKRRPKNHRAPKPPVKGFLSGGAEYTAEPTAEQLIRGRNSASKKILRDVRRYVSRGHPTGAYNLLKKNSTRKILSAKEFAYARAKVAHGYYVFGKNGLALKLAQKSARDMGDQVPMSHWIAGLSAWRMDQFKIAEIHFEAFALSNVSRESMAAGAYWASRSNLRNQKPGRSTKWLAKAATEVDTFYGILAREALGIDIPFDWSLPKLTENGVAEITVTPGGRRAVALVEIGRADLAERELRKLHPQLPEYLHSQMMTFASRYGMAGLSIRLAGMAKKRMGHSYLAALYPVPDWEPEGGFTIDRALIYAIVRKESGFNPRAKSRRGASGLMQIMPATAAYVAKDRNLKRKTRYKLLDPAYNLELGQKYFAHLVASDVVKGDLFALLAAYNAGPGNLSKWRKKVDFKSDPLLFIESIPARETRAYIERTLKNVWIYRHRLNQKAPSLSDVAAGEWPGYYALETDQKFARDYARN